MGNIGDTISTSIPTVGSSGPTYATDINALLTEFKARLEARIPLSSLLANSSLDMNGESILNAGYLTLVNVLSSGASPSNRLEAQAGNLYWVSPTGTVQITNGPSLNAAGIGGITGDYSGAGPMEFRYDTANTRYDAFANQSTNTWAYVRARGFDIAGDATSNFRARLAFGGGANVTYTLPSAAPAAKAVLQMDATGAITASTADDITLSGTAELKHGDRWITQDATAMTATSAYSVGVVSDAVAWTLTSPGAAYIQLKGLKKGDRLKAIKLVGDTTAEPTYAVFKQEGSVATAIVINTVDNSLDANFTKTLNIAPHTVTYPVSTSSIDYPELLVLRVTTNSADVSLNSIALCFDRP
jgi:hypothetical protein